MITLAKFIDRCLLLADKRNNAPENPVTLLIESDVGKLYVAVSMLEPHTATLPLNVLWINSDPTHADYKKALRRTSTLPYVPYRNTWEEITEYEEFSSVAQFWDSSSTFQLGEIEITQIGPATPAARGYFSLLSEPDDPLEPIVVCSDDPRMSDARTPTAHTHPEFPASMLVGNFDGINQDTFVTISNGRSPVAGEVLLVTGVGSLPNELVGYWRRLTRADIEYDGPEFVSITVTGPSSIDELLSETYTATAHFDDSTSFVIPATWSTSTTDYGTIGAVSGVFTANEINGDKTVTISATWFHEESGVQKTGTMDVNIIDVTPALVLDTLSISGAAYLDEGSSPSPYTVTAHYTDGTSAIILPETFTSSNPLAGVLDSVAGVFTPSVNVTGDQSTTLTASYTERGITRTANAVMTVVDKTVYPASAIIQGQDSVNEGENVTYLFIVTYTDGATSQVPVTNWASNNPAAGTINTLTGDFSATPNLNDDVVTRISASFTQSGVTVSAFKDITVKDATVYPESAVIVGSDTVDESTTVSYLLSVTFSDASVQTVNVNNWTSSNATAGSISPTTGAFTAEAVTSDEVTTLSANYTSNGRNVSATKVITVKDTTIYPVSGVITGASTLNEGSTTGLIFTVTFTDSSISAVTPVWTTSDPAVAEVSESGVVTGGQVSSNTPVTITATYTVEGVTITSNHVITVVDLTAYPVSAEILGPATVNENTVVEYTLRVTKSDSTSEVVSVDTFSIDNPDAGVITGSGSFTAASVTGNKAATISASYTAEGITVSDTHAVSVIDLTVYPESAIIVGDDSVNEGANSTYILRVTFTDSSVADVPVTNWASSQPSFATINADTGVLSAQLITGGDKTTTLSAGFTQNGVTRSATKVVNIVDLTVYPESMVINGPSTVPENTTQAYTITVTFTDSSSSTVPADSWSSSNVAAGTIDSSGVLTANSVSSDQNTTLTANYTSNGVTITKTRVVTVQNIAVLPQSVVITGPTSVTEGSIVNYVATVTYTDNTTAVRTLNGTWSVNTGGSIVANSGAFTAAQVAANTPATISFEYTENGTTVNATYPITVMDVAVPQSRYGVAQFADLDFTGGKTGNDQMGNPYERWTGPADFITTKLTNFLPNDTDTEVMVMDIQDGNYGYFAHPKVLGKATFVDTANGYENTLDGASWGDGDVGNAGDGPLTVIFDDGTGPIEWYVYRTDFYGIGPISYRVSYPNN